MATAQDVAAALLDRHLNDARFGVITTMKLNKLLYAALGIYLAETGEPLFEEEIEAWDLGPVVPSVYNTFHGRRRLLPNDLTALGNPSALNDAESKAVDKALDLYGAFSGDALSELSHAEAPWREAFGHGRNSPLDHPLLAKYFREILDGEETADDATAALLSALGQS